MSIYSYVPFFIYLYFFLLKIEITIVLLVSSVDHLQHESSQPSSSPAPIISSIIVSGVARFRRLLSPVSLISGVAHLWRPHLCRNYLRCNYLRHLFVIELNVFVFCVKNQLWKWLQNQILHLRHSVIQMCLMWIWNHTIIGVRIF